MRGDATSAAEFGAGRVARFDAGQEGAGGFARFSGNERGEISAVVVNAIYSLPFVLHQGPGTEEKLIYPLKTLSQLPLVLKGFRKEKGLTQAAMAERLGITQQSYAYFEANPAKATVERLFMVLRMQDVEISLDQTGNKAPSAVTTGKAKPSAVVTASRRVAATGKKDSW